LIRTAPKVTGGPLSICTLKRAVCACGSISARLAVTCAVA
jgi:hypothetical protein